MKSDPRQESFARDLQRLRDAYPMTCVIALTPDDFSDTSNGPDEYGQRPKAEWGDPRYEKVAKEMDKIVKGEGGKFWMLIRRAMANSEEAGTEESR